MLTQATAALTALWRSSMSSYSTPQYTVYTLVALIWTKKGNHYIDKIFYFIPNRNHNRKTVLIQQNKRLAED